MYKKVLILVFVAATSSLYAGPVSAKSEKATLKRVITHDEAHLTKALADGCEPVRQIRSLSALLCPADSDSALNLEEDIRVFAVGNENKPEANRGSGNVSGASINKNDQIGATVVQASGNTGVGRKVAILDTGYNYLHPELSSSFLGGKDFVNGDDNPMDDQGHGSHVAGIITGDGVSPEALGVAPGTGIISGKVLDSLGSGFFSDVVAGIYWAVDGNDGVYGTPDDFNVDAINLSLGTSAPYTYKGTCNSVLPELTSAISYAVSRNVPVVVAAGNSGNSGVSIPGCISYSTTVGAVDSADKVASFSGRGNAVDISAPGVNIYSSILGNNYASWSGTSMATPVICGVIALMKSAHPAYTQGQVESKLFSTVKDLGKAGKDTSYGWGRVRANLAVQ